MTVSEQKTLKQLFSEIPVRIKLNEVGQPTVDSLDKRYLNKVKKWLQSKLEQSLVQNTKTTDKIKVMLTAGEIGILRELLGELK